MRETSLWDLVGNTPLIYLKELSEQTNHKIFGKAEFLNPAGSIKDRAAKGIIQGFELRNEIKTGSTIVEGTAGNTGIALATLANERGYNLIITMPDNQSEEKYAYLRALNVDLRLVKPCPFKDQNHFYHQAKSIADQMDGAVWANQFENTDNARFHYESTGPEIWKQTEGGVDYFIAAVGSGGTIGGTSKFLKEKNKDIKVIAADPMGSGIYEFVKNGSFVNEGSSITEGIGIMRETSNFAYGSIDDSLRVSDQEMIEMATYLSRSSGLVVGTSAALNVRASYEFAKTLPGNNKTIVTVLCDHGSRYANRIFNPTWLKEKQLQAKSLF